MPPRTKYSRQAIIDAAFDIVRREGWPGLSARAIARELNASTRPIYSSLESMGEIEDAVMEKALDFYVTYLTATYTGDPWIDNGIGFLLFARDEKKLFRAVNDEAHTPLMRKHSRKVWASLGEALADYPPFAGLEAPVVQWIRVSRWMFLHGMATLIDSGRIRLDEADRIILLEKPQASIANIVRKISRALLIGLTTEAATGGDDLMGSDPLAQVARLIQKVPEKGIEP